MLSPPRLSLSGARSLDGFSLAVYPPATPRRPPPPPPAVYRLPAMARILSRTLVARESRALVRDHPPASRLVNLPGRSGRPEKLARIFEVELEPENGGEAAAARRLVDVIYGIAVRRAAPDWLPFIPGSSYWVPPRPTSHGLAELLRREASPMTEEEVMSLTTAWGWPCAAYLRGDVSQDTIEKWLREVSVQPEDEDS